MGGSGSLLIKNGIYGLKVILSERPWSTPWPASI